MASPFNDSQLPVILILFSFFNVIMDSTRGKERKAFLFNGLNFLCVTSQSCHVTDYKTHRNALK